MIHVTFGKIANKAPKHAAKRLYRGVIPTEDQKRTTLVVIPTEGASCHGEALWVKPEATERRDL